MATYATLDDLLAYVPGLTINDPALAEQLLGRAERDVDSVVAWRGTYPTTFTTLLGARLPSGLRIDPTLLEAETAERLRNAVCAQWEYRVAMGPDFFVRPQPAAVRQPEGGGYDGTLPRIGPQVFAELEQSGLLGLSSSTVAPRRGLHGLGAYAFQRNADRPW
jgi:hypothetical protein